MALARAARPRGDDRRARRREAGGGRRHRDRAGMVARGDDGQRLAAAEEIIQLLHRTGLIR
jgi:hypothetical protein